MPQFDIQLRKLIVGKYFANFASVMKGAGLEIDDFRKYVSGDPYRFINRKMTAKHDELYVDIFRQDKDIHLDLFCDINYNWKGGHDVLYIQQIELFLREIFGFCGKNNISIDIYHTDRKDMLRTRIGRDMTGAYQRLHILPKFVHATKKKHVSQLAVFLQTMKLQKKRRAIVIFSDFLSMTDEDRRLLQFFQEEHALQLYRLPVANIAGQNYLGSMMQQSDEKIKRGLHMMDFR